VSASELQNAVGLIPDHMHDRIRELVAGVLELVEPLWHLCQEHESLETAVHVVANDGSGWFADDHASDVLDAVGLGAVFDALVQFSGWIEESTGGTAPGPGHRLLAIDVTRSLREVLDTDEPTR
jgi:hypothetical protein